MIKLKGFVLIVYKEVQKRQKKNRNPKYGQKVKNKAKFYSCKRTQKGTKEDQKGWSAITREDKETWRLL